MKQALKRSSNRAEAVPKQKKSTAMCLNKDKFHEFLWTEAAIYSRGLSLVFAFSLQMRAKGHVTLAGGSDDSVGHAWMAGAYPAPFPTAAHGCERLSVLPAD